MFATAADCKKNKHHPEWSNTYDTIFVRWTTHRPKGLSEKDVLMAEVTDANAKEFGEVVKEEEGRSVSECQKDDVKGLVKEVVESAGDCCGPRKAKEKGKIETK